MKNGRNQQEPGVQEWLQNRRYCTARHNWKHIASCNAGTRRLWVGSHVNSRGNHVNTEKHAIGLHSCKFIDFCPQVIHKNNPDRVYLLIETSVIVTRGAPIACASNIYLYLVLGFETQIVPFLKDVLGLFWGKHNKHSDTVSRKFITNCRPNALRAGTNTSQSSSLHCGIANLICQFFTVK